jgi:Putative peptidoglycan binding domain
MKRLVTLVTVLLVGLASMQAAQSDDQQKKKRQTNTTQATPAPSASRMQTSNRHVGGHTSSNQQVATQYSKKKSSTTNNYRAETVNKANKSKKQNTVVTNNNVQVNKNAWRHFKRSGNEVTFNVARTRFVRERHDRNWWRSRYSRIVFYGGGYWYWNAGWWYPAWGYNPYYNNYIYNGPIFGYGGAFPGDVTGQVQRALAARGYYYGPIDGILGPSTRNAIQRYQIDRGLAVTAAIDEPTLATLGLA